jgi:hypothetical protein
MGPSTNVALVDGEEIGAAILMTDGRVMQFGADSKNAIYTASGTWLPGPDFPTIAGEPAPLGMTDGAAALLPSGRILAVASPGAYATPTHFLETDGTSFQEVAATPNAPGDSCFQFAFLLLPTGQVMALDQSQDIEIYTPTGAPDPSWAPVITNVATSLARGSTYVLSGKQLNGLSAGTTYGDDVQSATNYPIVRITNDSTGHVFYARTHDHSSMGVATGSAIVTTSVDVPAGVETGASHLEVVANGIASTPVAVTVQ